MSGPGFGNKTAPNVSDTSEDNDTRFDKLDNVDSYSGATDHGSGTTAGAGFGNKTNMDDSGDMDTSDTKFTDLGTDPYTGATAHGSGSTAGAGIGNKTGGFAKDSKLGKLMEKGGTLLHSDGLIAKGHERREAFNDEHYDGPRAN